jgi:hypothetical protein
MKHPHHEVILAYLNDELVQFYHNHEWVNLDVMSERVNASLSFPSFPAVVNYRIKPTPKPDIVRYTLIKPETCDDITSRKWDIDNLKLTFNGETLKLIKAEVMHEQKTP